MNRLTNAFASTVYPSSTSATAEVYNSAPRIPSPDAAVSPASDSRLHSSRPDPSSSSLYDDPRSTRWAPPFDAPLPNLAEARPKRPGLLRGATDDGSGRPTPRGSTFGRGLSRDRGVRVNLLKIVENKKGWKGGGGGGGSQTGGRLSGLAKGPDGKFAVGGGQYLRVLQVTPGGSGASTPVPDDKPKTRLAVGSGGAAISEVVNLWRGSYAVGKGVNDIDWGIGQMENKVVTATPSGNFLIFDVNRGRLDKEVSGGNPRPMNTLRLCKVASHSTLLLTGGTEGQAKLWDLRDRDPAARKSFKHSVSVTSLCFSPSDPHHFVIGLENGTLCRYDIRGVHKTAGRAFGAHGSRAVMDLKWVEDGAEGDGWLASAGLDRTVQIWDMSQSWSQLPTPLHVLHTAHPLRRVHWRPNHPTELITVPLSPYSSTASAASHTTIATGPASVSTDPHAVSNLSQALDHSTISTTAPDHDAALEVWDVRRHYLPKYAIPTKDGPAVDLFCNDDDDNSLVVAFAAGGFGQVDVGRGRTLPIDEGLNRQLVAWDGKGDVAYAVDRFKVGEIPFDDLKQEYTSHWDKVGRRSKGPSDRKYEPLQAVGFASLVGDEQELEFAHIAEHYRLEGDRPEKLCLWNREVAAACGRTEDARVWSYLQLLLEEFGPRPDSSFNEEIFSLPLPSTTRLPTPPPLSPRHDSAVLSPSNELSKTHPVATSPQALPSPPIRLEKLDLELRDTSTDLVDDLLSPSPSGSSSSSGSATPPTNGVVGGRFTAFQPPSAQRISELHLSTEQSARRPSAATITPTHMSSPRAPKASRSDSSGSSGSDEAPDPDTPRSGSGTAAGRGSGGTGSTSMSMSSSRLLGSEWPNPYGITGTSRDASSRASPTTGRSTAPSPKIGPTVGRRYGSSGSLPKAQGTLLGSVGRRGSGQPLTGGAQGSGSSKHGEKDKVDREAYKKLRCGVLLDWWRMGVDDGDVQLATALAVVGKEVIDFPEQQCERIAHAYLEMLERRRLLVPAAYIRAHAQVSSLQTTAGEIGITHVVHCHGCGKSTGGLDDVGTGKWWWCKRCQGGARNCTVCHLAVKGMWMGCGKCKHGGHQRCMRVYYLQAPIRTAQASVNPNSSEPFANRAPTSPKSPTTPISPKLATSQLQSTPAISGFGGDSARTSGEMTRETATSEGEDGEMERDVVVKGWTVCPKGCGCQCRVVPVLQGQHD